MNPPAEASLFIPIAATILGSLGMTAACILNRGPLTAIGYSLLAAGAACLIAIPPDLLGLFSTLGQTEDAYIGPLVIGAFCIIAGGLCIVCRPTKNLYTTPSGGDADGGFGGML